MDNNITIDIDFPNQNVSTIVKRLLQAGLEAANPTLAVKKVLSVEGSTLRVGEKEYGLNTFDRIMCVGAGKASGEMALALEHILGSRISGGYIAIKDIPEYRPKNIQLFDTSHPIPNTRSVQASKQILSLAQSLTQRDLLFVLISGGASSLIAAPAPGLSLNDKKLTTSLLLRCGATIQDINTVRKHLSAIKGGQLAASTSATIITLVLSDVLGDDLTTIGSGPTIPDPTTFQDAKEVLRQFHLLDHVPVAVKYHLEKGIHRHIPETPKIQDANGSRVHHQLIGNNQLSVEGIAKQAEIEGIHSMVVTNTLEGEAREVGKIFVAIAKKIQASAHPIPRPACLVWGGEPTVTVKGTGRGGRAQELVLSAAIQIAGLKKSYVAGFGTDGSDGPTDVAGAIVDGRTVKRAKKLHLDPQEVLSKNDSYKFFKKVGGHIHTGTTGTNVNDVYIHLAL